MNQFALAYKPEHLPSWPHIGASWALGPLGLILGPLRLILGPLGLILEGQFGVNLGSIWGPFGVHLASIWGSMPGGPSDGHFCCYLQHLVGVSAVLLERGAPDDSFCCYL